MFPLCGLYGLYSFYNGLYHGLYAGLYVETMPRKCLARGGTFGSFTFWLGQRLQFFDLQGSPQHESKIQNIRFPKSGLGKMRVLDFALMLW